MLFLCQYMTIRYTTLCALCATTSTVDAGSTKKKGRPDELNGIAGKPGQMVPTNAAGEQAPRQRQLDYNFLIKTSCRT